MKLEYKDPTTAAHISKRIKTIAKSIKRLSKLKIYSSFKLGAPHSEQ